MNRPIARIPGTISPNDEVDRLTFVSYPQERVAAVPSIPDERCPEHPMKRRREVLLLAGPRIATITRTLSPVQFQPAIAAGLGNGARQLWSFRENTSDRLFLPTVESRAVRTFVREFSNNGGCSNTLESGVHRFPPDIPIRDSHMKRVRAAHLEKKPLGETKTHR